MCLLTDPQGKNDVVIDESCKFQLKSGRCARCCTCVYDDGSLVQEGSYIQCCLQEWLKYKSVIYYDYFFSKEREAATIERDI